MLTFAWGCNLPCMELAPGELTWQALLAHARARGCAVTKAQLDRWHLAGLLARPRRRALGRGRGTASLYPASAAEQLVAAARAMARWRRTRAAVIVLWGQGFPVTPVVRRYLREAFQRQHAEALEALAQFEREDPENFIERSASARLTGNLGRVRRRVGKARMPTVVRALYEAALGGFHSEHYDDAYDEDILRRAVSYKGEPLALLAFEAAEFSAPAIIEALNACSDEELERYRDEVRWFLSQPQLAQWKDTAGAFFAGFYLWFLLRRVSPSLRRFVEETIKMPVLRSGEEPRPSPAMIAATHSLLNSVRPGEQSA